MNSPVSPAPVHLEDYVPPAWLVDQVQLDVDVRAEGAIVTAVLACRRNPALVEPSPLCLNGVELETLSVAVDGRLLSPSEYTLSEESLVIDALPAQFTLETRVRIQPDKNTQLSVFYRSKDG